MKDEDLSFHLKLHHKQVRTWLAALRAEGFVKSINRKEEKAPGTIRQVTYWFLDRKAFLDTLKLRLYRMYQEIDKMMKKALDIQNYVCARCGSEYSAFDVPRLVRPPSKDLHCERCGNTLTQSDTVGEAGKARVTQKRMHEQIKPLMDRLRALDGIVLPRARHEDLGAVVHLYAGITVVFIFCVSTVSCVCFTV